MKKTISINSIAFAMTSFLALAACGPSNGPSMLGSSIDNGSIGGGDGGGDGGTTPPPVVRKKIWIAYDSAQYGNGARSSGNFGGIAGADAKCASRKDPSVDAGAVAKAFLVDGQDRIACTTPNCSGGTAEHVDWVLAPDTEYEDIDGNLIFKTNSAGIFDFSAAASNPTSPSFSFQVYSGLTADWTSSANNCQRWTDLTGGHTGAFGASTEVNSYMIFVGAVACSNYIQYACVEQ